MTSPCKDCQRRTLGCHNVDECQDWKAYVELKKRVYAARKEVSEQGDDFERHQVRHRVRIRSK